MLQLKSLFYNLNNLNCLKITFLLIDIRCQIFVHTLLNNFVKNINLTNPTIKLIQSFYKLNKIYKISYKSKTNYYFINKLHIYIYIYIYIYNFI